MLNPPPQVRAMLGDTTVEAACEVLAVTPAGVLMKLDELSGWFGSMEKYNSGKGAAADRAVWLQAWNGGPYAVNRIIRGAKLIENLSVSLLGGVQPELIRKVAADFLDDGLLQRMFPVIMRPAELDRDEPASGAVDAYGRLVERLHTLRPPTFGGHGNLAARAMSFASIPRRRRYGANTSGGATILRP